MGHELMESQIKNDVEKLAAEFPQTQDLYREVSTLLFFRYGVTPTANGLYQLVRRGSMSAPATALQKFWENLREKCRVQIDTPDLPEELKTSAAEMILEIWTRAQREAKEAFAEFRIEAETTIERLRADLAVKTDNLVQVTEDLATSHRSWEASQEKASGLELELAGERATKEALAGQLEELGRKTSALEDSLVETRREFTKELEQARLGVQKAEEKCMAVEASAKMELERERSISSQLQLDIVALHQDVMAREERHQNQLRELQEELGLARQGLGVAEGALAEMRKAFERQAELVENSRKELSDRDIRLAVMGHDLGAEVIRSQILLKEVDELKKRKVEVTGSTRKRN